MNSLVLALIVFVCVFGAGCSAWGFALSFPTII